MSAPESAGKQEPRPRERSPDVSIFVAKLALAVFPFLAVPLINYQADPGLLFHPQEGADIIVRSLRQGFNVTGQGRVDDRWLQSKLIQTLDTAPDLAVFGSSRVQLLSSSALGRPLINNGVGAASLNDLLAIYGYYRERGLQPRAILIGVDPWMLNENHRDLPRRRNSAVVRRIRKELDLGSPPGENFLESFGGRISPELFSPTYFRTSLRAFLSRRSNRDSFVRTLAEFNRDGTRLTDGSVTYGEADRNRTQSEAAQAAEAENTNPFYGFEDFTSVSEKQRTAMIRFLGRLCADSIAVRLVMMPFHPTVYAKLERSRSFVGLGEVERVVRGIADEARVPVTGSYSAKALGWNSSDFLDGKHPRASHVIAIAKASLVHDASDCLPGRAAGRGHARQGPVGARAAPG